MLIYHIVLPEFWEKFKDGDFYEAESLTAEGFIHCSFAKQIDAVLNRYYKNAGKVLLLQIDTEKLTSELINESSTNIEIYPHIYGKINTNAIIGIEEKEIGCR
ncbi:MAG: DUF952 domain-containing protein [Acidobacteria bacterium]|jgi:uncharacterized protein (DUF952 family)|nr:DUF952 domain-containing protein [Acidobacteriota bacterium]